MARRAARSFVLVRTETPRPGGPFLSEQSENSYVGSFLTKRIAVPVITRNENHQIFHLLITKYWGPRSQDVDILRKSYYPRSTTV
jgi:hypothetical protein